ncbi:MAG: hypothetical protein V4773_28915 [Verrucomicrobiota bacterium]
MKLLPPALGVVVVALLIALFLGRSRHAELQAQVAALEQDRAATMAQLKKLDERVLELQRRPATQQVALATAGEGRAAVVPVAETAPVEPVERPGVTVKAPAGWNKNGSKPGSYVVGVDTLQTWGGMPSAYVESLKAGGDGFGGMMQTTSAENFEGQRVRLSGWVKTEDANNGGGHLWLRVDGQQSGQMLQFDNMNNRAVKGTADWQEASIVLDVPAGASALAYGFFVEGGGKMWVNGVRMERVGAEVASTNMYNPQVQKRTLPKTPVNLGFYPQPPK